ncbi:alpha/beta fold hydrolase [Halogeometricum limi]|uniref:Haloalkane dehalogenase n=1 Tax=Halogeometricum limi TaxID=555875 RepID=A0A1I6HEY7_9EURY|nr:alpha/beta fold hydrolase [Halogeometricum limi]SFR53052.1 haloalkane dehalogenase [Halogeometricum limi]
MESESVASERSESPEDAHTDTSWVDRDAYPFETDCLRLTEGAVNYVDEGPSDPAGTLLMLHGNPTWSFLYRHLVRGLSDRYRCVALDYLGFGLSERPEEFSYRPEDHAVVVEEFVEALGLEDVILVVQDWGGPIGLSYAVDHPENVRALVVMNTFAWPVDDDAHFRRFSALFGGALGRVLCERYDLFTRVVMPLAFGDRRRFPASVREQYVAAHRGRDRTGTWMFPRRVVGSSGWLASLWNRRERIAHLPTRIVWGMNDAAFRASELRTFEGWFEEASVVRLRGVGHYVQEEMGEDLVPYVREFLESLGSEDETGYAD